jgi:putative ABC transport system permease protein
MLALGEGLSQNIVGRISSFTQGDVSIQGTLSQADLAWILEQPYTKAAIGTVAANSADVVVFGKDYNVGVLVLLGDLQSVQPFTVTEGSVFDFNDASYAERVLVTTKDFDDTVRNDTGRGIVGTTISVGGQVYDVVGTVDIPSAGFRRTDGNLYVPYRSALGVLTPRSDFSGISVSLKDSAYFEIAGKNLLEGLNASRYLPTDSTDLFSVSSAQSIIESAQQTTAMISLFLGIVGGIALFVGGIGTMNMMLTTVTERTKEIGLRKAIGARRRDILLQILIESIFLTLIGGGVGIFLTITGAYFANRLLADNNMISVIVSPSVVALATVVAIAVGLVFGLYPANRASKLQPVDALRAE